MQGGWGVAMSEKKNLLEAILELLAEHEPDQIEAIEAMAIIQARLALDIGFEVSIFAMLADKIEGTIESDERREVVLQ